MNIGSGERYLSNALSNFAPHPFFMDGVLCNSMEGFLQSLKFSNPDIQKHVCTLIGLQAKYKGKKKNWWRTQTLYWQGKEYSRHEHEYQDLLWKAYNCLAENDKFRSALLATGKSILRHSLGKNDATRTILTENEFCSILMKIRENLRNKK